MSLRSRVNLVVLSATCLAGTGGSMEPLALAPDGAAVYRRLCVRCHGEHGEGVAGKTDEPLRGGRSVASLTRVITRTMPDDDPDRCVGKEAAAVAAHIHGAFYARGATSETLPVRLELQHLTARQQVLSLADVVGSFGGSGQPGAERGLRGEYFTVRNFARDKRSFERRDDIIDFQFGEKTPDLARMQTNEFSVRWQGSLWAPETGDYEFVVTTENGARLWLNDDRVPLIDGWVSSGPKPASHRARRRLLGGRAYPLRLDYFKYQEKTASIRLAWKPPHRVEETIPRRCLMPRRTPPSFVPTTPFPADDSSMGFARGTDLSPAWQEAVTRAALETARYVADHLAVLGRVKPEAPDREARLRPFAGRLVERAFRRPLSREEWDLFVERPFATETDPAAASKRCVLLALCAPQFLYPDLRAGDRSDHAVAARLALTLWDSLPDRSLREAADRGRLRTEAQVLAQARRMLADPRAREKMRHFLHHWLKVDEKEDLAKDPARFPGFDPAVIADLRVSLDRFLDDVVWEGDGSFGQLLLADHVFLNERLARFYGVPGVKGPAFRRVPRSEEPRAGVLTQPYVLATFAYYGATSPIHRGVFLTRNLLGRRLKPPPQAIRFEESRFQADLTMREKVTELTRPANCQTCHAIINPLGFGLEQFDAVGRYRTFENGKPVDPTGEFETLDGRLVRLDGARALARLALNSQAAQRGFVEQMFQVMTGQSIQAYGPRALDQLRAQWAENGFKLPDLFVTIGLRAALTPRPLTSPSET